MPSLRNWIPDVAVAAPGCPDPEIIQAVRDTIIELCTEALVYERDLASLTCVEGQANYTFTAPENTQIHLFREVSHDYVALTPCTRDDLPFLWQASGNGTPRQYYADAAKTVHVFPAPAYNTSVLRARAWLRPTEAATTVDSEFWDRHRAAVMDGALARLLFQPGKPWTNPDTGALRLTNFRQAMFNARIMQGHDHVRAEKRVLLRPWT
jgi:hypothetical protein